MTSLTLELRPYQNAAKKAVFNYFKTGGSGHPLVVAPTGSGKSIIIAGLCAEIFERWPEEKVLIVTHTQEIIQQDSKALRKFLPYGKVGIYSQGLGSKDVEQFTVAGIQSVYNSAEKFKGYNLIIVDEAHLIPPEGEGRYRTFFAALPNARVVGFTATPFRRAHGLLTENHMFDRVVYDIPIQDLIDQKHIVRLTTKAPDYVMETKGLKIIGGDYSKAELSRRLDNNGVTSRILPELQPYIKSHKHWLVFCIDIDHCEHVAQELNSLGMVAAAVHSKLDIDRKELLDLFKSGHIQALTSVETLTTGFDAPDVDLIVMLRPTTSPVLHVQMLGRGMRTAPGKDKCLVLDFAGNVQRLGPVDAVEIPKAKRRGNGGGEVITRACPICHEILAIAKRECPECGYIFPIESKLNLFASTAPVLKADAGPLVVDVPVARVTYSFHKKAGKPPSMRVSYITSNLLNQYNEWIGPEHLGYPAIKARQWWRDCGGDEPIPTTVSEMLRRANELRKPSAIRVNRAGKYPEIVRRLYGQ